MNNVQLFFAGALLALFIGLNRLAGSDACAHCPGGLPLYVWPLALVSVGLVGFVFARLRVLFAHRLLTQPVAAKPNKRQQQALLTNEQRLMYDPEGPAYPHPV